VRRPGQDLGEAAGRLRPFHLVEPERVLVFLIKADRALGARDLVGVAHLAAGGDAAEEQVPHGAVFKPAHHLALIVIVDRAAGAGCMDGFHLRHQAM
jgi:hypothetical protein